MKGSAGRDRGAGNHLRINASRRGLLGCILLLLLSACKRDAALPAAEAEALDYVRLAQIALSNAYAENGQRAIAPTPCTDPMFGLKKTTRNLVIDRCTVHMQSAAAPTVAALFNGDLAVLADAQGVRKVPLAELPALQ